MIGSLKSVRPVREVSEAEKEQRGKEILFLFYYLWKWMDMFKITPNRIKSCAIAVSTLTNCDAVAIQEMMELKYISTLEDEDIQWKTEHGIYPYYVSKALIIHCVGRVVSRHRIMQLLDLDPRFSQNMIKEGIANPPTYFEHEHKTSCILHKEHWICIEQIMWFINNMLSIMPERKIWNFNPKIILKLQEAENEDNGTEV